MQESIFKMFKVTFMKMPTAELKLQAYMSRETCYSAWTSSSTCSECNTFFFYLFVLAPKKQHSGAKMKQTSHQMAEVSSGTMKSFQAQRAPLSLPLIWLPDLAWFLGLGALANLGWKSIQLVLQGGFGAVLKNRPNAVMTSVMLLKKKKKRLNGAEMCGFMKILLLSKTIWWSDHSEPLPVQTNVSWYTHKENENTQIGWVVVRWTCKTWTQIKLPTPWI